MSNFYTTGGGRQSFDDDAVDRASNSTGGRQPLTGGRGGRGKSAQQQSYSGSGYGGGYSAGGYNDSYMQQDVRDQGFDVRADFDGDGPRWSEVYGVAKQETYRPVYDHDIDFEEESSQMGGTDRKGPHFNEQHRDTEMVSVPVLGPEWTKDELHDQSKSGKSQLKHEKRRDGFRAWNRDQRGCCGIQWMTRTIFVFIFFFFIVGLILTLYFVIPRTVAFKFYDGESGIMSVDPLDMYVARQPPNFTFPAELHLMADSSSSWIPVQFSNAQAKIFDSETMNLIATGELGRYKMPRGKAIPVKFPVKFAYTALNSSDVTWWNMYNACQYQWNGVTRDVLNWRLEIKESIVGMVPHPTIATTLVGAVCPFNFSTSV